MTNTVLLHGGQVWDGSGGAAFPADVLLQGNRIAAVRPKLSRDSATTQRIDVSGRMGASMVRRLMNNGHECGGLATAEEGFLHCGPHGAGHFVKMVHNGIEYGVMAAYAEGFNILRNANVGKRPHVRNPEFYQYELNLPEIAEVWRRGSVIGSWLLDLTAGALLKDSQLAAYGGCVSDSGEGRWTIQAAIDEAVPTHVLSAALYERFTSRGEADFANQLLSAMRHQFGGHVEMTTEGSK